jgi:hypothetical protein
MSVQNREAALNQALEASYRKPNVRTNDAMRALPNAKLLY